MRTTARRFVLFLSAVLHRLYSLLLPIAPQGFQKMALANHPSPEVRRKALIALGAKVSDTCHLNQGIRLVMDYPDVSYIEIGQRVAIAPNVQFICNSGPHPKSLLLKDDYVKDKLVKDKKISIGDDTWIGAGVIILPGVSIGRCAVVGAGALVINDVPEFSIVAGSPARVIRLLRSSCHE